MAANADWLNRLEPAWDDDLAVSSLERRRRKHESARDVRQFYASLSFLFFIITGFLVWSEVYVIATNPQKALTGAFLLEIARGAGIVASTLRSLYKWIGNFAWTLNAVAYGPDFQQRGVSVAHGAAKLLATALYYLGLLMSGLVMYTTYQHVSRAPLRAIGYSTAAAGVLLSAPPLYTSIISHLCRTCAPEPVVLTAVVIGAAMCVATLTLTRAIAQRLTYPGSAAAARGAAMAAAAAAGVDHTLPPAGAGGPRQQRQAGRQRTGGGSGTSGGGAGSSGGAQSGSKRTAAPAAASSSGRGGGGGGSADGSSLAISGGRPGSATGVAIPSPAGGGVPGAGYDPTAGPSMSRSGSGSSRAASGSGPGPHLSVPSGPSKPPSGPASPQDPCRPAAGPAPGSSSKKQQQQQPQQQPGQASTSGQAGGSGPGAKGTKQPPNPAAPTPSSSHTGGNATGATRAVPPTAGPSPSGPGTGAKGQEPKQQAARTPAPDPVAPPSSSSGSSTAAGKKKGGASGAAGAAAPAAPGAAAPSASSSAAGRAAGGAAPNPAGHTAAAADKAKRKSDGPGTGKGSSSAPTPPAAASASVSAISAASSASSGGGGGASAGAAGGGLLARLTASVMPATAALSGRAAKRAAAGAAAPAPPGRKPPGQAPMPQYLLVSPPPPPPPRKPPVSDSAAAAAAAAAQAQANSAAAQPVKNAWLQPNPAIRVAAQRGKGAAAAAAPAAPGPAPATANATAAASAQQQQQPLKPTQQHPPAARSDGGAPQQPYAPHAAPNRLHAAGSGGVSSYDPPLLSTRSSGCASADLVHLAPGAHDPLVPPHGPNGLFSPSLGAPGGMGSPLAQRQRSSAPQQQQQHEASLLPASLGLHPPAFTSTVLAQDSSFGPLIAHKHASGDLDISSAAANYSPSPSSATHASATAVVTAVAAATGPPDSEFSFFSIPPPSGVISNDPSLPSDPSHSDASAPHPRHHHTHSLSGDAVAHATAMAALSASGAAGSPPGSSPGGLPSVTRLYASYGSGAAAFAATALPFAADPVWGPPADSFSTGRVSLGSRVPLPGFPGYAFGGAFAADPGATAGWAAQHAMSSGGSPGSGPVQQQQHRQVVDALPPAGSSSGLASLGFVESSTGEFGAGVDGADADGGSGAAGGDEAAGASCTICWSAPRQVGFLHGKTSHLCVCRRCASQLREGVHRCPICRQLIERIIDIYN